MIDFQNAIFRQVMIWPVSASVVLFGIGALYNLQGFRFARVMIACSAAFGGFVLGGIGAQLAGVPVYIGSFALAVVVGVVSLVKYRVGTTIASGLTVAALGQYLAVRLGLLPNTTWICGALGGVVGLMLASVCGRALPIVLTTVQGSALMIVGFVGIAGALAPTLAQTFVEWSDQVGLFVPTLYVMLVIVGGSVQVNQQQGDIKTGGAGLIDSTT